MAVSTGITHEDIMQDEGKPGLSDEITAPVEQAEEVTEEKAEIEAEASPEEETEDSGDDTAGAGEDADEDKEAEKKPKKAADPKVQKRIDKLTKDRHDAERRAERAEALLAARSQVPEGPTSAPDPTKYDLGDSDPNYLADLVIHKQEGKERGRREQAAKQDADADWTEKVRDASSRYADFATVAMVDHLPVTTIMGDAIRASDVGADVLYYLGQNPGEARRISSLPPIKQALEIGKIETRFEGEAETEAPPKRLTAAPAPAKRVTGRVSVQKDPTKMSMEEYRAWRGQKAISG